MTSSTSLTSGPISCRRLWQHGHAVVSGSMTCSQRLSGWGDVAEVSIDLAVRNASSVLGSHRLIAASGQSASAARDLRPRGSASSCPADPTAR